MILDGVEYVRCIRSGDQSNLPTISNSLWMAEVMGELRRALLQGESSYKLQQ